MRTQGIWKMTDSELKALIKEERRAQFYETIAAIKEYAINHNVSRLIAIDKIKFEDTEKKDGK